MALDMDIDIGSLIKGLFSKKESKDGAASAPNPHGKTALVVIAVLVFIGLYVYFVYIPTQKELQIKNDKISQIESIKSDIAGLTISIETAEKDLLLAEAEFNRRSKLFHNEKELEDLYGEISLLAMSNKLTITKIEKGIEMPIFSEGFCGDDDNLGEELSAEDQYNEEEMTDVLQKVGYYEFKVNLEISGNYTQFTNFRNGLAQLTKILNINKESIVVPGGAESKGGEVKVSSIIATYRLPKNETEACADPNSIETREEF